MNIKIEFFNENFIQAIGAGIYEIIVCKNNKCEVLYIGESVFVLVRCATHLYKLKKNPAYFGFTKDTINDSDIKLIFNLIENDDSKKARIKKEIELIKEIKPLTQSGIRDYHKDIEERIIALTNFIDDSNY